MTAIILIVFTVLSLLQSTAALIFSCIAYRDSRPVEAPHWHIEDESKDMEVDIRETAERLLEAERRRRETPESWEEHERNFRKLMG